MTRKMSQWMTHAIMPLLRHPGSVHRLLLELSRGPPMRKMADTKIHIQSDSAEILEKSQESRNATPLELTYWKDPKHLRLLVLGAGLIGFFLLYGVLQERIMTLPYDDATFGRYSALIGTMIFAPPHTEPSSAYLVLNNRLVACFVAVAMLLRRGETLKNVAPLYTYGGVSLSNVFATWSQYEALKYVSFPTQTLGKCGKMIPVMIIGALLSGKRYGPKDYVSAGAITLGCMIFVLTGILQNVGSAVARSKSDTPYGLFLIMAYLFCDGLTSTLQEKLFRGYSMSTYQQMLYVNLVSAVFSFCGLLLTGEFLNSIAFSSAHPLFAFHSVCLSLCAVFGQMIIYTTIKEFGALIFSTIMTTRQFLNILLSCLIYLHPLGGWQWLGVIIVFGVLYYKAAERKPAHGHSAPSKGEATLPTTRPVEKV